MASIQDIERDIKDRLEYVKDNPQVMDGFDNSELINLPIEDLLEKCSETHANLCALERGTDAYTTEINLLFAYTLTLSEKPEIDKHIDAFVHEAEEGTKEIMADLSEELSELIMDFEERGITINTFVDSRTPKHRCVLEVAGEPKMDFDTLVETAKDIIKSRQRKYWSYCSIKYKDRYALCFDIEDIQ